MLSQNNHTLSEERCIDQAPSELVTTDSFQVAAPSTLRTDVRSNIKSTGPLPGGYVVTDKDSVTVYASSDDSLLATVKHHRKIPQLHDLISSRVLDQFMEDIQQGGPRKDVNELYVETLNQERERIFSQDLRKAFGPPAGVLSMNEGDRYFRFTPQDTKSPVDARVLHIQTVGSSERPLGNRLHVLAEWLVEEGNRVIGELSAAELSTISFDNEQRAVATRLISQAPNCAFAQTTFRDLPLLHFESPLGITPFQEMLGTPLLNELLQSHFPETRGQNPIDFYSDVAVDEERLTSLPLGSRHIWAIDEDGTLRMAPHPVSLRNLKPQLDRLVKGRPIYAGGFLEVEKYGLHIFLDSPNQECSAVPIRVGFREAQLEREFGAHVQLCGDSIEYLSRFRSIYQRHFERYEEAITEYFFRTTGEFPLISCRRTRSFLPGEALGATVVHLGMHFGEDPTLKNSCQKTSGQLRDGCTTNHCIDIDECVSATDIADSLKRALSKERGKRVTLLIESHGHVNAEGDFQFGTERGYSISAKPIIDAVDLAVTAGTEVQVFLATCEAKACSFPNRLGLDVAFASDCDQPARMEEPIIKLLVPLLARDQNAWSKWNHRGDGMLTGEDLERMFTAELGGQYEITHRLEADCKEEMTPNDLRRLSSLREQHPGVPLFYRKVLRSDDQHATLYVWGGNMVSNHDSLKPGISRFVIHHEAAV